MNSKIEVAVNSFSYCLSMLFNAIENKTKQKKKGSANIINSMCYNRSYVHQVVNYENQKKKNLIYFSFIR